MCKGQSNVSRFGRAYHCTLKARENPRAFAGNRWRAKSMKTRSGYDSANTADLRHSAVPMLDMGFCSRRLMLDSFGSTLMSYKAQYSIAAHGLLGIAQSAICM